MHPLREQQPVQSTATREALAVDGVRQALAVERERGHRRQS
jgi:hypothetical protein